MMMMKFLDRTGTNGCPQRGRKEKDGEEKRTEGRTEQIEIYLREKVSERDRGRSKKSVCEERKERFVFLKKIKRHFSCLFNFLASALFVSHSVDLPLKVSLSPFLSFCHSLTQFLSPSSRISSFSLLSIVITTRSERKRTVRGRERERENAKT